MSLECTERGLLRESDWAATHWAAGASQREGTIQDHHHSSNNHLYDNFNMNSSKERDLMTMMTWML